MIIDRFEVIKGPSSTLYGSEAVAGVINIITKDPEYEPDLSIDMMGTTLMEHFGNISFTPQIGNNHGFIGANYAYANNYVDNNGDGFGDDIHMDRLSLFTKWDIERKSEKQLTVSGKYYYEDRRNGIEQFVDDRNYRELRGDDQIYGESIYTKRGELFGTYALNTDEHVSIDYSLSTHQQNSFYGADEYNASQNIAFGNLIWQKDIRSHKLLAGLTTRYNAYDDNTIATEQEEHGEITNRPDNQFIPGLFVQDEFEISEALTLLGGLRLDSYEGHGLIISPRLNAKYNPTDFTTFRANAGTGFRVVNLFTEDHAFITGQRVVDIQEELQPEESYNGSLNILHEYFTDFGTGTMDVNGYYTYFTNKINPDYSNPQKIIYENSDGYAVTKGVGLTVTHTFQWPLGIQAGVNVQEATRTEHGISTPIEFAPEWSGVGTVNYSFLKQDIVLGYTARFTGQMTLPEVYDLNASGQPVAQPRPTKSDPYSIHTLQLQKTLNNNLRIYGGVQNITNFRQASSPLAGFRDPNAAAGFSEFFDTSYAYAPNHGREVYLGLKWEVTRNE